MKEILFPPNANGPLGPFVTFIDKVVCTLCAIVLWICFFAMFLPTLINTILRYTTNASLSWSVEIIALTFPWFIMAGAVLASQHSRHIRIEYLLNFLSEQKVKWLNAMVECLIILTASTVIYVYLGMGMFDGGIKFAAGDAMYTSLGVSQSWSYSAIFCGYFLLCISALTNIYRQFTGHHETQLIDKLPDISS